MAIPDILTPAPSASAALHEAARVRRAILRALRRQLRTRFQLRDACELCRCDAPAARNAIETLKVGRLIVERQERGGVKWFELTELGKECAEL